MYIHTLKNRTGDLCCVLVIVSFCASVLVSSAANAQVLYETTKIMPSGHAPELLDEDATLLARDDLTGDGQSTVSPMSLRKMWEGYRFGRSIAVASGVVAISLYGDEDGSGPVSLFDVLSGELLFKLLPDDRIWGNRFGTSIALDIGVDGGGIVAVGAGEDGGRSSGTAYLFDASTGEQLFKLLPDDGAEWDRFGSSIAIDNNVAGGIVAVGAVRGGTKDRRSGAAYLFDASTGEQLFKLLPDDGAVVGSFGRTISIDNGIVAVGAFGSVYLFDVATGEQLFKLFPNNDVDGKWFGRSVAIDNGIVAVGVYVFDAATGNEIVKLRPTGDVERYPLSQSIAIDNGIVVAGAYGGRVSGSAYLFDATTGEQLVKLLPSDGARMDFFGYSISIDNGIVAVGAVYGGTKDDRSGAAYIFDVSHLLEEHAEKKADQKEGKKGGDKANAPYEPDQEPECCSDK